MTGINGGNPKNNMFAPGAGAPRKRPRRSSPLDSAAPPRTVPEKLGPGAPLRLVIVGHNPSAHAWQTGHYYSNPSNRMWPILVKTGIAPPGTLGPEADDAMPTSAGVGFTDVGSGHPGTDSSDFKSCVFEAWGAGFYQRLLNHTRRASDLIGCTCGTCGAPAIVAFAGKRQFLELFNLGKKGKAKATTVATGPQGRLPDGWPLPPRASEVWVCSSTSGASALTREAREAPWEALAERLRREPWPRRVAPQCRRAPKGREECAGGEVDGRSSEGSGAEASKRATPQ